MSEFVARHIGPRSADVERMLTAIGASNLDDLVRQAVPAGILDTERLDLPAALTESEALDALREIAAENEPRLSMIGCGYYGTFTPAVLRRNLLENPAWYTAYTPYQPEISQGRLEALLLFQTMVSDLTGLDVSNASLLDEPTAAAEAMSMARRASRSASAVMWVDADTHPQTKAVLMTRTQPLGIELVEFDVRSGLPEGEAFGLLISYPSSTGRVSEPSELLAQAKGRGVLSVVATDLLALSLIPSPGALGADIAVGSAQRFGVPMGFGGPHAGFIAVRSGLERNLPGRLVGVSRDSHGQPAYRLALQTREQHIRRERATSNICTSQVLLAVASAMFAVYHGPEGIREIAERVHARAAELARAIQTRGGALVHSTFFDTVAFVTADAAATVRELGERGVDLRLVDDTTVCASVDEVIALLGGREWDEVVRSIVSAIPPGEHAQDAVSALPRRQDEILAHPTFHAYRSETEMMRYLRTLSDKDYALDRGMIPLGSCTMKLNAATEMESITWPEFAGLHPFAPAARSVGTRTIVRDLVSWLSTITGYDSVSLQPNAGSQGEFAGLLAIRGYLDSIGQTERDVCLIPSSAHGTNAASAVMAGMRVVVVSCDESGNVDLSDLDKAIDQHRDSLAALMITYPSTHGVYEQSVSEICERVHGAGGQVYVDGANLNALVGLAKPGRFGADVSHLNLHKTFCIPHGGGGPGVGPVAVRAHLAPFLPSHPFEPGDESLGLGKGHVGAVSGAPFGSAGILTIPWAYLRLMGSDGLVRATHIAVLSANYVAERLKEHYPVLYRGASDRIAHECILDLRPLTKSTGVTVDDVAKRLIDYGFHAPTMSFPVAGTLMVEPTESESMSELDRFCDAMIAIRQEIRGIEEGLLDIESSPLRHAPHTAFDLVREWDRAYDRVEGVAPATPTPMLQRALGEKYWPPVGRIEGAYGDRNLVCSCPDPSAFESTG